MSSTSNKYPWSAWAILCFLALVWGSSFMLMKRGLKVFTPWEISLLRIAAAGTFFLPTALLNIGRLTWRHYWLLATMGLVGIFLPAFLFAQAQVYLDGAINGALTALVPLCVLLLGATIFGQPITYPEIAGVLLGISGTLLLVLVQSDTSVSHINHYALLPVVGCLGYGLKTNLIRHYLHDLAAHTIIGVAFLFMGTIAGVILLSQTDFPSKLITVDGAYQATGYILVLGVIGSAVAFLLSTILIKLTSAMFASMVSFLIPVVALGWGLLDGEVLFWQHYGGIGAIMLSVYFINRS